jgi:hypothetical protein
MSHSSFIKKEEGKCRFSINLIHKNKVFGIKRNSVRIQRIWNLAFRTTSTVWMHPYRTKIMYVAILKTVIIFSECGYSTVQYIVPVSDWCRMESGRLILSPWCPQPLPWVTQGRDPRAGRPLVTLRPSIFTRCRYRNMKTNPTYRLRKTRPIVSWMRLFRITFCVIKINFVWNVSASCHFL